MSIPNADSAYITSEKLTDYLLNLAHPVGGPKARWFISLGYDPDEPSRLERDLLEVVRTNSDYIEEQTDFGVKYIVRGQLASPSGHLANVCTVWIVESNELRPRLVTAYPDE